MAGIGDKKATDPPDLLIYDCVFGFLGHNLGIFDRTHDPYAGLPQDREVIGGLGKTLIGMTVFTFYSPME